MVANTDPIFKRLHKRNLPDISLTQDTVELSVAAGVFQSVEASKNDEN